MSNIAFRPVRCAENDLENLPRVEGSLYFATDSGKIYLDTDSDRLSMGSAAGAAIFYGTADDLKEEEDSELVNISKLQVDGTPKAGDLILNKDGSFYKVSRVADEYYVCTLLSISGTGGDGPGGPSTSKIPVITKLAPESYSLINGTESYFDLEANAFFEGDVPVDDVLRISVTLATKQNINDTQYTPYWSTTLIYRTQENGYSDTYGVGRGYVKDRIPFKPRESTTSYLIVQVLQGNHDGPSKVKGLFDPITSSILELKQLSSYSEATRYPTSGFNLQYNVNGAIDKKIKFYFDGVEMKPNGTGANTDFSSYDAATWTPTFTIPAANYNEDGTPVRGTATHGYHTVEVQLCQMLGNTEGNYVTPLKYELAVAGTDPSLPPIIWLGSYKEEYSTYDNIQIPFMVWDPAKTTSKTEVHLYKNDIELEDGSPIGIEDFTEYSYWEIADADFGQLNKYQISCGDTTTRTTKREIRFTIVEDSRGMKIEEADLMLNFHATGRTNAAAPAKRQNWSYKLGNETKYASFNNFNWSNNGWDMDKEASTSYLCISNGAQLVIPYKQMIFASDEIDKQSHSLEIQFKVRNIQKYEKLISNITRYKNDSAWHTAFESQTEYSNYDAWLQANLTPDEYEALEFQRVDKKININNVVGGLYDYNPNTGKIVGFCIGTQDAFFTNGTDTVNIDFVENELINISFVYQHSLKQLYIYINGCITGVIKSTIGVGQTFSINSGELVFNSHNCDFDLYKVRIYQKDLNVSQIVKNFAVDRRDVDTFDQNGLAIENDVLREYQLIFKNVTDYIDANPDKPLMPYIIFDTGNINSKLPYSKKDKKNITVEFVNVPLEQAYRSGKLESLAERDGLYNINTASQEDIQNAVKTYYKHHCPSFISTMRANDKVNFEVQGTSSEFYPRRNYKIKTKVEGNFNWVDADEFTEEEKAEMKAEELQKLETDGGMFTEEENLNIFMNRGPFAEAYKNDEIQVSIDPHKVGYETTRLSDGWYMNNYTNATDRWTMKVDYMESSGSYNAGYASLVGNSYTKHPLQDYLNVMTNTNKLKPLVTTSVCDDDGMRWEDFRTSLLGFPVMAFWKRGTEADKNVTYTFIGYYRMLLDKSSTQVLGFKTPKSMMSTLVPEELNADGSVKKYKRMRDVAECWEFSNNARGYCSYRDPWNRVELSFKPPVGVKNEYTDKGAPIVANSFEYRYHCKDDYIDKLYAFDEATQAELNEVAEELGLPENSIIKDNRPSGADALLTTHTNWEKVCKWLWSTNLDAVESQGRYIKVPVGDVEYKTDGSFFYINANGEYIAATEAFDAEKAYYKYKRDKDGNIEYEDEAKTKPIYEQVDATTSDYLYVTNKFYYLAAGLGTETTSDDVYAISNDAYDGSIDYYEFVEGDASEFDTRFDLLVAPVDVTTEVFDAEGPIIPVVDSHIYDENKNYFTKEGDSYVAWTYTTAEAFAEAIAAGLYYRDHYYTWHGTEYSASDETQRVVIKPGHATGAVRVVAEPSETDWAAGLYYKASPVRYVNKTYTHDTKEYRVAKFTNEFENHFDPEYVATYFIMTEVFECYDSRGKNCMMASWGPHREGGEYIWYPIFYDIDTQLGINNTGIPSFEFNVDATEANNFSTSDSILWNNFYKFFKKTWMLPKYQNLRQISTTRFEPLLERDKTTSKAPLQSVDYIEQWYNFDYDVTHNLACQGVKPLIATNLDLYFKYITITNSKALDQGVAHLDDSGNYAKADGGTYFYALQGDRSQSRRQFLTNRLEYIDSWLTQKNYARGGANRLWGRISANNTSGEDVHSDKWVENNNNPYWVDKEFGTKSHEFDAEYWLELKPIRSSYVTAGDDSANYPSEKYDGVNKMYFVLNELENGIRISNNYPEQLLYIYGTNQMSDFGDLSKMYWTEFKLEGNADKLTRLKLGHDGLDADGNGWYNRKLNGITLPDLPLLKEANFCNINITADKRDLNLTASEKLENFRATGSNINSILFAKGVALNTLYLPSSVTALSLEQANLLTDLITEYKVPEKKNGQLEATPGLYLEGFFEEGSSSALNTISFKGGSLGYNSYTILKKLYSKGTGDITMHDVVWCPYTKLTEGDIYEDDKVYYKDNGHYGFEAYTSTDEKQFNADVLSGLVYRDDGFGGRNGSEFSDTVLGIDDDAITMLKTLYNNDTAFNNATGQGRPDITGIIYINNATAIDEGILNSGDLAAGKIGIGNLQQYYPNVTFFFANVNKAYSAKFVLFNDEDYSETYVKWMDGSKSPSVQKIQSYGSTVYFNNPFELYKPEKQHYVFKGWSLDNRHPYDADGNLLSSVITVDNPEAWNELRLTQDKYDYTYYAIFEIREYALTFYNHDGSEIVDILYIPYEGTARIPTKIPYRDDSQLDLYQSYNFKGYSFSIDGQVIDITTVPVSNNEEFYACFELIEDIRTVTHPEWFKFTPYTYAESTYVTGSNYTVSGYVAEPVVALQGKVVIPRSYQGQPVVALSTFTATPELPHRITHVFMERDNGKNSTGVNPVTDVWSGAFLGMYSLTYFEFESTNLRHVGQNTFQNCGLDASKLTLHHAPLRNVEYFGFNGGITSSEKTALILPSSLIVVGPSAFSYLSCIKGTDLIIGSADEPSKLNLSEGGASEVFIQNEDNAFGSVTFHSEVYDEDDEVNGVPIQDFFGYNMTAFVVN